MANDRCWLVCKVCGGRVLLAKHFGDDWATRPVGAMYRIEEGHLHPVRSGIPTGALIDLFVTEHGGLIHGSEEMGLVDVEGKSTMDRQPFAIEYEA